MDDKIDLDPEFWGSDAAGEWHEGDYFTGDAERILPDGTIEHRRIKFYPGTALGNAMLALRKLAEAEADGSGSGRKRKRVPTTPATRRKRGRP